VTIIVGIVCADAIVLASDSQTTSGTAKRTDTEKITSVNFANLEILVAQAGYAPFSGQAVEIFTALAKDKEATDYRTVAETAELAMRKLKDRIRFQQGDCTMEELREFVWQHELGCELMIACHFEGKPYLFTIDMVVGVANKVNSRYEAIGCGANLGAYLLSELCEADMHFDQAAVLAVYVVEIVKNHDAYCGGQTKLGIIHRVDDLMSKVLSGLGEKYRTFIQTFSQKEIDELSNIATTVHEVSKVTRSRDFLRALVKKAEKEREQMQSARQSGFAQALPTYPALKKPESKEENK
jgi:20S proteasome alpha/beta subunit